MSGLKNSFVHLLIKATLNWPYEFDIGKAFHSWLKKFTVCLNQKFINEKNTACISNN
jgi:hypothetical protein